MDQKLKILIIEDDESLRSELTTLLAGAGYCPIILDSFDDSVAKIIDFSADLILLDINMPKSDGRVLLKEIRKQSDVPIIMVTSRNSDIDEATSILYGADDFITKPYSPTVLLLRISNVLKRLKPQTYKVIFRGVCIDLKKGVMTFGEKKRFLTKNEMIILSYLLENQDRIVRREELMTELWNNDEYINDNALTVNISRLRTKLACLGLKDAIETRVGIGYILK